MGSRSMRAGMIWLVLGAFCSDEAETVMDLAERMGVERLMEARLSSAGLMSGILPPRAERDGVACKGRALRGAEGLS